MDAIIFWTAAAVAGFAALNVILQSKPVNSVLSLVVVLFALAVIYVQLSAEFIAALQIIIYAGAIMVLFLFVVMLLNLHRDEFSGLRRPMLRSFGILIGGTLLVEITLIVRAIGPPPLGPSAPAVPESFGSVNQVGHLLFERYLLPFELTSILLLVAVAGALVLAGRPRSSPNEEKPR